MSCAHQVQLISIVDQQIHPVAELRVIEGLLVVLYPAEIKAFRLNCVANLFYLTNEGMFALRRFVLFIIRFGLSRCL